MWRNVIEISRTQLRSFETHFRFTFHSDLGAYLLTHNNGSVAPGIFPTAVRERKLDRLLDLSDSENEKGAWAVNKRLRKLIGPQRIIIGIDAQGNYVCVERDYRQQKIVVWNHVTDAFEDCLWDIPAFLRYIG